MSVPKMLQKIGAMRYDDSLMFGIITPPCVVHSPQRSARFILAPNIFVAMAVKIIYIEEHGTAGKDPDVSS